MDERFLRLIYKGFRISRHRKPNDTDKKYWLDLFRYCYRNDGEAGVDYAYKRLLGMDANSDGKHPEDVSPYGEYGIDKVTPPPPPYPEEYEETHSDVPHDDVPHNDVPPVSTFEADVLKKLDQIILELRTQRVEVVAAIKEAGNVIGKIKWPF